MKPAGLILLAAGCAGAQLPDFYKHVARVTWVVQDAGSTAQAWTKLGLAEVEPQGDVRLPIEFRGKPAEARIRWFTGWMGSVAVDLIQPLSGANGYTEYLERHGDGIFGLMYEAPSLEALNAEAARLKGFGVGVLQRGDDVGFARAPYLYFDTEREGKYALGLVHYPEGPPQGGGPLQISQFAFVVRDYGPVSRYWEKLGFPPISVSRPQRSRVQYRGRSLEFEQDLGWQRHGTVPFEWCKPPAGENVYREYLDRHGEGLQHLGVSVEEMDQAVAAWPYPVAQAGGWGEAGKKGSGRFAYIDTDKIGGVTIELLWSQR